MDGARQSDDRGFGWARVLAGCLAPAVCAATITICVVLNGLVYGRVSRADVGFDVGAAISSPGANNKSIIGKLAAQFNGQWCRGTASERLLFPKEKMLETWRILLVVKNTLIQGAL
jgi:hypothetical protein